MNLTDSQISTFDEDLNALIDGIGARDENVIAGLMDKYKVDPDGEVANMILRLMGEKVKE